MSATSGKFGDLGTRVVSAIALIVAAVVLFELGGLWVAALLVAGSWVMLWEYQRVLSQGSSGDMGALAIMALAALVAIAMTYYVGWLSGLAVLFLGGMALVRQDRERWMWLAAGLMYIGAAAVAMLAIFLTPGDGLFYIFWVVLIVALSDIGGYFAGRIIGGAKLWPAVSPKKTWSGTIGGWVLAVIAGVFLGIYGPVGIGVSVGISLVLSIAAQAGDLLESWLKRRSNVKDASEIIPGHGGFLDRMDGLVAAIMVFTVLRTVML